MPFKFNPFTGNFDVTSSKPDSYLDGEVATYSDLPLSTTTAPLNSAWLVRSASGVWPVTRKQAGIYVRTASGGSSRDADYTYAGTFPDVFSDANFVVYNESDSSKNLKLDTSAISSNTTRTLTVPDESGTLALVANTATADQGALADTAVQPNTSPVLSGVEVVTTVVTPTRRLASDLPFDAFGNKVVPVDRMQIIDCEGSGDFDVLLPNGSSNDLNDRVQFINSGSDNIRVYVHANGGYVLVANAPAPLDYTWKENQGWEDALDAPPVATTVSTDNDVTYLRTLGQTAIAGNGTTNSVLVKCAPAPAFGAIDVLWPHASGTLALTSDITGGSRAASFTSLAATGLSLAAGTITASAPFSFAQTWNNAAVTFTGLKLNVTDTASNAASLFLDFQIGGSPKTQFTKLGSLLVYNTYTSSTNYERGFFKWDSNVLKIGTEKGSGGGTARALEFWTDGMRRAGYGSLYANAWTFYSVDSALHIYGAYGTDTTKGAFITGSDNGFFLSGNANWSSSAGSFVARSSVASIIVAGASGILLQTDSGLSAGSNYTATTRLAVMTSGLVGFGGTTSSFPALKRSTTTLQARLADDSAFTAIQGKLTTDTNAAAGTITPDKTLTLYDAAGTAYKVPCVAA